MRVRNGAWPGIVLIVLGTVGIYFGGSGAQRTSWMGPEYGGGMMGGFLRGTTGPWGYGMMGAAVGGNLARNVSKVQALALGDKIPSDATVSRKAKRITFHTKTVRLAVLASPEGQPDETFRIAGMVNPSIVVPRGANVTIQLVNADMGMRHDFVVTAGQPPFPYMAMMAAPPAFPGSASPVLAASSTSGMQSITITFKADSPGSYTYLCTYPGHAQRGMYGMLIVT